MATWGEDPPRWQREIMRDLQREAQAAAKEAEIRRIEEAKQRLRRSSQPPQWSNPQSNPIADILKVKENMAARPQRQESAIPDPVIKQYAHVPDEMLDRMQRTIVQVKTNIEMEVELIWCAQATDNVLTELTKVNMGYHVPKVIGMGPNVREGDESYPFLSWEDLDAREKAGIVCNAFNTGLPDHLLMRYCNYPSWLETKIAVTSLLIQNIKLGRATIYQDEKGFDILRQEKKEGGYPYKQAPTGMVLKAQEANMGGRMYGQVHTAGATMLAGTMVKIGAGGFIMPCPSGDMAHGFVIEDVAKGNSCRVANI